MRTWIATIATAITAATSGSARGDLVTIAAILTRTRAGPKTLAMARLPRTAMLVAIVAIVAIVVLPRTTDRQSSDAAPTCGAVASHFMFVAEQELAAARVDDATRRAVQAQLSGMRDSLAAACAASQWTEQVRRCLHAAGDHVAFEACQQELTEAQRRALDDRAARDPADPP